MIARAVSTTNPAALVTVPAANGEIAPPAAALAWPGTLWAPAGWQVEHQGEDR
jgi:hypothetical protein